MSPEPARYTSEGLKKKKTRREGGNKVVKRRANEEHQESAELSRDRTAPLKMQACTTRRPAAARPAKAQDSQHH